MKYFLNRDVMKTTKHIKIQKFVSEVKKKKSKNLYFQKKLKQYENNIENTGNVMKAVINSQRV